MLSLHRAEELDLYTGVGVFFAAVFAADVMVSPYFHYRQGVRFFTGFLLRRFGIGFGLMAGSHFFISLSVGFEASLVAAINIVFKGVFHGIVSLWACFGMYVFNALIWKRR